MTDKKKYFDVDGNSATIMQMIKKDPEWVAGRFQLMEKQILELEAENITLIASVQDQVKSDEWRVPDETTPNGAAIWAKYKGLTELEWHLIQYFGETIDGFILAIVKENEGPPPDDWIPKEKQ